MTKLTYSEKLKDPRWQKKRLRILERDKWACRRCYSTTKELQIHHLIYEKGREPWEAEDFFLKTLCKDCHAYEERLRQRWNLMTAELCPSTKELFLSRFALIKENEIPINVAFSAFARLLKHPGLILELWMIEEGIADGKSFKKLGVERDDGR